MTPEAIKTRRAEIDDACQKLYKEKESLDQQQEALDAQGFLALLKGTTWRLVHNDPYVMYYSPARSKTKDAIEKLVMDEMHLYPHGSSYVAEKVKLICDDGTIIIRVDPTDENIEKNGSGGSHQTFYENVYNQSIEFANKHKMILDIEDFREEIKLKKDNLEEDERMYAYLHMKTKKLP